MDQEQENKKVGSTATAVGILVVGIIVAAIVIGLASNNSGTAPNQQPQPIADQQSYQDTSAPPQNNAPGGVSPQPAQDVLPNYQPNVTPQPINYSQFQSVDFGLYAPNPNQYSGSNISVIGMLDNVFLPSTGGAANYIEITNPAEPTQPKIEIEVDNQADYTSAVNGLQPGVSSAVFVRVYGSGANSQQFSLTNGQTHYYPVINATRIDRCTHGTFQTTMLTGSKLSDVFSCSAWKTIFAD